MSESVYRQDGLVLVVRRGSEGATVSWSGASDNRHPDQFLIPLVEVLGKELQDVDVTIDLRELEYMNSSTVVPLIKLVKRLGASGKSLRVLFLDIEWQRTHSNCMSAIARTLKNVRIERLPPP